VFKEHIYEVSDVQRRESRSAQHSDRRRRRTGAGRSGRFGGGADLTARAGAGGKDGIGWVNKPVSCGGVIVNPGDIVVADDDGVIAFAPDHAEFVVEAVSHVQRRDVTVRGRIANGERIFEMANFGETVKIHDLAWRPDR
jgi:hypothetical protein